MSREDHMVVIERNESDEPTVWCDPEIADLVRALNSAGIKTIASCSGHGYRPGNIALADGRYLTIATEEQNDTIQRAFPVDVNGNRRTSPSPASEQEQMPTASDALEALDAMDDYARMDTGVDATGPHEVLRAFIQSHNGHASPSPAEVSSEGLAMVEFQETWPERIYLQQGEGVGPYSSVEMEDVTWCQDSQFKFDIPYIRADLVTLFQQSPATVEGELDFICTELEKRGERVAAEIVHSLSSALNQRLAVKEGVELVTVPKMVVHDILSYATIQGYVTGVHYPRGGHEELCLKLSRMIWEVPTPPGSSTEGVATGPLEDIHGVIAANQVDESVGMEVVGYRYTFADGKTHHFGRTPHPNSAHNIEPLTLWGSAQQAISNARRGALEEAGFYTGPCHIVWKDEHPVDYDMIMHDCMRRGSDVNVFYNGPTLSAHEYREFNSKFSGLKPVTTSIEDELRAIRTLAKERG